MNYMPNYVQTSPEPSPEQRTQIDASLLRERSLEGLCYRLRNQEVTEATYKIRLEAELQILERKGYCSYYLIVADYVQWAKENDIAVGPGRGSGPCSLVAYALGITNIDPIRYGLPFERFVNPERNSTPDFDLDFCSDRCSEVTSYIQSRYGADRVAQISSDSTTPLPARLIISNQPLANVVPLYKNPASGIPATTLNLKQVAALGMIQFNAIEQKALSVIQRTIGELKNSGTEIDIEQINLNDKRTYKLLSQGEARAVSGYDDQLYKQILTTIQPDNFDNLCATIALHHPQLQKRISQYKKRKQNPDLIKHIPPSLESFTTETLGLVLYQEQFMDIAHQIAGFSYARADSFRRALGKSDSHTPERDPKHDPKHDLEHYKVDFIHGAISTGLSQNEAENVLEYITPSDQRTFTKAHAVCYALLTYRAAYLKANFPSLYQAD